MSAAPKVIYPPDMPFMDHFRLLKCARERWDDPKWTKRGGCTPGSHGLDWVLSGRGRYRDALCEPEYGPGTLILVRQGRPFLYDPLNGEHVEHVWIRFVGPVADALMEQYTPGASSLTTPPKDSGREYERRFIEIIDIARTHTPAAATKAGALLLDLVVDALFLLGEVPVRPSPEDVCDRFLYHARAHATDRQFDVDAWLATEGLSRDTFGRRLKDRTGLSPHAWWLRCKMDAAKSLLETTDLSVSEIAGRVGMTDAYYFSRLFKRKEGVSPSRFRDTNRG